MANNPPYQHNPDDLPPFEQPKKKVDGGWFSMSTYVGAGFKALEMSSNAISAVGSSVQNKLDESGVSEKIATSVSYISDNTKYYGEKAIGAGSDAYG